MVRLWFSSPPGLEYLIMAIGKRNRSKDWEARFYGALPKHVARAVVGDLTGRIKARLRSAYHDVKDRIRPARQPTMVPDDRTATSSVPSNSQSAAAATSSTDSASINEPSLNARAGRQDAGGSVRSFGSADDLTGIVNKALHNGEAVRLEVEIPGSSLFSEGLKREFDKIRDKVASEPNLNSVKIPDATMFSEEEVYRRLNLAGADFVNWRNEVPGMGEKQTRAERPVSAEREFPNRENRERQSRAR